MCVFCMFLLIIRFIYLCYGFNYHVMSLLRFIIISVLYICVFFVFLWPSYTHVYSYCLIRLLSLYTLLNLCYVSVCYLVWSFSLSFSLTICLLRLCIFANDLQLRLCILANYSLTIFAFVFFANYLLLYSR